jgi:hypothetical protein
MLDEDQHWNSDPATRTRVMDRIAATHVNTVVMSFWSNMREWSPMVLDATSLPGVLDAVQGHPLVIMPAIEGGVDPNPTIPQWQFSTDFPSPQPGGPPAPGLIERIGQLVDLFRGRMDLWARLYDRAGEARYAVQIIHAFSEIPGTTDFAFSKGFANVATEVYDRYQILVGFTLDTIGAAPPAYVAAPAQAGRFLKQEPAVLAVHGFESEVFSGKVKIGPPCQDPDWRQCHPYDNNVDNLENLVDW